MRNIIIVLLAVTIVPNLSGGKCQHVGIYEDNRLVEITRDEVILSKSEATDSPYLAEVKTVVLEQKITTTRDLKTALEVSQIESVEEPITK